MYNRLFTKILDSSIWLEPLPTRVVWITLLAAMDEDGFAAFACAANVARRAGVDLADAEAALDCLMAPDRNSSDPENDGRRLEKIAGGYLVLNAAKYRAIFSREIRREQTRKRVENYRKAQRVTQCNAGVTLANAGVTQSEAEAEAEAKAIEHISAAPRVRAKFEPPTLESVQLQAAKIGLPPTEADKFFNYYTANGWRVGRNPMKSWPHALANWKNNATGYAPQSAASNADRVLWSRERQAIAERLKAIKQQASQSADGTVFLSDSQKAERKRLKERDAELMRKLGQSI